MAERITGHTELIGLMAYPIRHSSSPAMHNEAFATLGLDYAYLAFEVDNSTLEDAVKGLRALKMVGSNVSMPNNVRRSQHDCKRQRKADRTYHGRHRIYAVFKR